MRLTFQAERVFPTGLNGVLRGGLVASATALWLLGPDDHDERVARGIAIADQWYYQRIEFQKAFIPLLNSEHE